MSTGGYLWYSGNYYHLERTNSCNRPTAGIAVRAGAALAHGLSHCAYTRTCNSLSNSIGA